MEVSELWSTMNELPYGYDIIAVDKGGNWKYYYQADRSDFEELINDGFIKWCYVSDLVQAAYNM